MKLLARIRDWGRRVKYWIYVALGIGIMIGGIVAIPIKDAPRVVVDNREIVFPFCGEKEVGFRICIDRETYAEISEAIVYFAITNTSGQDQDANVLFYFNDKTKDVKQIDPLIIDKTFSYEVEDFSNVCEMLDVKSTSTGKTTRKEVCYNKKTGTHTATSTKNEWGVSVFNNYIKSIDKDLLLGRKEPVAGEATKKVVFAFKTGETRFFRARVVFPQGIRDQFHIEIIGTNGAYGLLE